MVGSPWITSVGQVKGNQWWKAPQIVSLRRKGEQDSLSACTWATLVAPKSHVKYGKHLSFTSRRGVWKRHTEDFCKDRRVVALRVLVYHLQVHSHFLISVVLSAVDMLKQPRGTQPGIEQIWMGWRGILELVVFINPSTHLHRNLSSSGTGTILFTMAYVKQNVTESKWLNKCLESKICAFWRLQDITYLSPV